MGIRSNLVHIENRLSPSTEAYLQAWDLGQWYVELLLLNLFGYEGRYANRITYNYGDMVNPEATPWT